MRQDLDYSAIHHPTDLLATEHGTILAVLDAFDRELTIQGPVRLEFWRGAVDFLGGYVERCHHAKEEALLFPALEAAGLARGGLIDVMRREHQEGREHARRLRAAIDAAEPAALHAAARTCVDHLRRHIEKQDADLFSMARGLLPAGKAVALLARCHQFDAEEIGGGEITRLAVLAARLQADVGAGTGAGG